VEIALRARASCQEDGCAHKNKLVKKRKTAAMTYGTDCTAATFTRVVWVGGEGRWTGGGLPCDPRAGATARPNPCSPAAHGELSHPLATSVGKEKEKIRC